MVTPYLVPSKGELRSLHEKRALHARIAILTNSLESAPEVSAHAGYMHYRRTLLQDGIELYEVRARLDNTRGSGESRHIARFGNYALHGKLIVFDRRRLYVGSMNFDRRSRNLNTEIGLLIDSPELAVQTVTRFDAMTQPQSAYRVLLSDAHPPKLLWQTREQGQTVVYRTEPARSAWQRLKSRLLSLLPLDSEL
jgi:putative cardiolipin synthase